MPKRTDINSIMIIGAGPIVIGQACEFDYSGAQACKALKEEGYRVILVNSNPATIMTDPGMADATYIEPITADIVAKIIEKERPDALLPTMGGQTGLNTALELDDLGVLEKFDVELIGAKRKAIEMAEDRKLFREAMDRLGLENPKATIITAPNGLQPRRLRGHLPLRHRRLTRGPNPHRRVASGLERIRDGSGSRHRRQRHHHLLHRKRRSNGRAHRRRRNRRLQCAIRH